jgi:hypothetical protein
MLILGQPFPSDWDGRPPGMTHDDWPIWMTFRWTKIITDSCYYYNVRVGSPCQAPSYAPDNYRRQWELASLYRIDAVGLSKDSINLYEVKSLATPQDLWQITTYRDLMRSELLYDSPITAWLIAEHTVESTITQAIKLDIRVWTLNKE